MAGFTTQKADWYLLYEPFRDTPCWEVSAAVVDIVKRISNALMKPLANMPVQLFRSIGSKVVEVRMSKNRWKKLLVGSWVSALTLSPSCVPRY